MWIMWSVWDRHPFVEDVLFNFSFFADDHMFNFHSLFPLAATQPRSTIGPSPCLTAGQVFCRLEKGSFLTSSVHRTCFLNPSAFHDGHIYAGEAQLQGASWSWRSFAGKGGGGSDLLY